MINVTFEKLIIDRINFIAGFILVDGNGSFSEEINKHRFINLRAPIPNGYSAIAMNQHAEVWLWEVNKDIVYCDTLANGFWYVIDSPPSKQDSTHAELIAAKFFEINRFLFPGILDSIVMDGESSL